MALTDTTEKQRIERLLSPFFDKVTIHRGMAYYHQKRVTSLMPVADNNEHVQSFTADVSGSQQEDYIVSMQILFETNKQEFDIMGFCTCPIGHSCKHQVAALLLAQERYHVLIPPAPVKSDIEVAENALSQWLQTIQTTSQTAPAAKNQLLSQANKKAPVYHLLYLLNLPNKPDDLLHVRLVVCRVLQKGGYGKPQDYRLDSSSQDKYLQDNDEHIITDLTFLNRRRTPLGFYKRQELALTGRHSMDCLNAMIETGRCFISSPNDVPLTAGPERQLNLQWQLLDNACQQLVISANGSDSETSIIPLDQLIYIDPVEKQCGPLDSELPADRIQQLLSMPPIPPHVVKQTIEQLQQLLPANVNNFPVVLNKPITKDKIKPIPNLYLDMTQIRVEPKPDAYYFNMQETIIDAPTMTIAFDYDGYEVPFSLNYPNETITYAKDNTVYQLKRDFQSEKNALLGLEQYLDLSRINDPRPISEGQVRPDILMLHALQDEEDYLQFVMYTLPQLETKGWRVHRLHEAFIDVLYEADVEWYSELDDVSQYDYFGFKLGVLVDGEQINMLPIITEMFQQITPKQLNNIAEDERIPLPLPNGQLLSIPFGRIKPMLNILVELFDTELNAQDALRLSRQKAALLLEIQNAIGADKLRWFGGDKLRQFGEKLASFKHIKTVKVPKKFKASLRNYQQDGVNWLQFLREYHMGGILADDMGLGKTVQTLAHLSIEKQKNRLNQPVLIIAPTSLMVNWRQEAAKFTPNLNVLVFHGDERHQHAEALNNYDLVLTTYPLLVRDKTLFIKHEFYYVILDEAQFIKNHKAKSTLIAQQLKATHRLCLTGTPMENHLGEMWSLFNFLMPGFLGDVTQFKRLFRTPIEKHDDSDRRQALAMRVKPFLLRRQKEAVLLDLPEKTEIIRTIELQGEERDLYESIRLSMEKKVRDAIVKNGLARSHIIILDALLKLRQVCCHSRLLKLEAAKKAHKHSSKLAWLKEFLPSMVEEGRKILLFSQFTTMLGIIEETLKHLDIPYVKLTGATKHRERPIESFQSGQVPVFLISLKAGGTGLNLTAADTVIHYDPWWNPAVEDQATDRAHRMGQNKAVFVYKLIAEGTVEETIQDMQQKKRAIVSGLFSDKKQGKLDISADDLSNLFKPIHVVADSAS